MEYELEEKNRSEIGVITHIFYVVKNYNGDEDALKEYVKELNDNSCFNINYFINKIDNNEAIIEEMIDTLD